MTLRLLLLTGLIMLLILTGVTRVGAVGPVGPIGASALSDTVTVVASSTAGAGTFGVRRVLCPADTVAIGGGIDVNNVLTMQVTSSGPVFEGDDARLITRPNGDNPAPVGWQASAFNSAGATQEFKVAVVCAPLSGVSTRVGSGTAGAGTFGTQRTLCRVGEVALGGGIDMDNVLTMRVTSSAPTFDADNARLISQPEGINPAPNGWQASALNNAGSSQGFKTAAICAPLDNVSTVVTSDTAASGTFGTGRVLCPADQIAVGGGVDMDNVLTMQVTSSAPLFPGEERLISQPTGNGPAPIGWQASALNNAGATQAFKTAAICAQPEHNLYLPLILR